MNDATRIGYRRSTLVGLGLRLYHLYLALMRKLTMKNRGLIARSLSIDATVSCEGPAFNGGRRGGGLGSAEGVVEARGKPIVIGLGLSSPLCLELLLPALEGGELGD